MKLYTLKEKIIAVATKRSHLKKISFILAAALIINLIPALFPHVNAEEDASSYISDAASELPDSRELERMYLEQLFYGNGISFYKDYGRTALEGIHLEIYEALRSEIEKVAAGERTETVFTVEISTPYNDSETFGKDISVILRYLMTDLPQDFYWYDKTKGAGISLSGYSDGSTNFYTSCKLSLAVSENYADKSKGTSDGRYLTINPARINAAKTAVKNAQDIAAEYNDRDSYEKILGYKNRICNLTEYNHEAAENDSTPYGDPWQLVYVFDDDPDTNVVCEGYSKAFQYLCDLGGIECYTVTGNLSAGTGAGGHMWNIVVLNGKSYLADITNCDGSSIGNPDKLLLKGADQSNSEGCAFNLSRTVIYTYDKNSLELYTDDILIVSTEDFDPKVHSDHKVCVGAENCPKDIHSKHQDVEWTEWSNGNALPTEAGNYYLTENVKLAESWEPADGTSLCLNGHNISAENVTSGIIYIGTGITFNLCDCAGCGTIGENTVKNNNYGGGVTNNGTFNMYSGIISRNYSNNEIGGGGVYNSDTFNMYGGEMIENRSGRGTVYNDKTGTFNMYSGEISGNKSSLGGGVNNLGTFNMYNGKIIGNNAVSGGSGVYNNITGTFNMHNGEISKNIANIYGGGVYNTNKFNMFGGEIRENVASNDGGGVDNSGTFTMLGGEIKENVASNQGGGVSNFTTGKFTMLGGEISGNNAAGTDGGGGVFTCNNFFNAITLGGDAVIKDNYFNGNPDNLYLYNLDASINLVVTIDSSKPLTGNAYIGITTRDKPTENKPIDITKENDNNYSKFFHSDDDAYDIVTGKNNVVQLAVFTNAHRHTVCEGADNCPDNIHSEHQRVTWTEWNNENALPTEAGNYYLTEDVTLTASWKPADGTSLCLNGHTVSATNAASGIIFIDTNKTFNLCDCQGVGKISGNTVNSTSYGGGVTNRGTFNMYSGKISGNTSQKYGGGVFNNSSSIFNMYGGEVSGNTSIEYGGGVYNKGTSSTFNMYSGKISENTSNTNGGGVYNNSTSSTFNMYSGEISGNISSRDGGGVYNKGIFKMLGGKISDNTINGTTSVTGGGGVYAYNDNFTIGGNSIIKGNNFNGDPDDLYLYTNKTIKIDTDNPLTGDAYIGVKTSDVPSEGRNVQFTQKSDTDYSEFFHSNNPKFSITIVYTDNTLWLRLFPHEHTVCAGADNCPDNIHRDHELLEWQRWNNGTSLPTKAGYYYLDADVKLTKSWKPVDGVSLCLNGHTISAANADSGIIFIGENITFNLCDCAGGGKISGNTVSDDNYGGGVTNNGTFNMYSGEISGNTSNNNSYLGAGGVYNYNGTFNMYDGEISGNISNCGHGGGVHNTGKFNLYGGVFTENLSQSSYGGGVFSTNIFNMYGGEIYKNTAGIGGAVYISGGTFNMFEGKLRENSASGHGGGICNCGGTFKMLGGEISGNKTAGSIGGGGVHAHDSKNTVGGTAVIKDNYFNGKPDDLYLPTNATVTIDPNNPLTGDAYIGIKTHDAPDEGLYIKFTTKNNTDFSEFFHSNNPDCTIKYIDNALWLRMPPHEHIVCVGTDNCPDDIHGEHELVEWTRWANKTALPTDSGYYFLAADVTLTGSWKPVDGVSLCLNGHTVSAGSAEQGIIYIQENNTFNLCDCQGTGKISGNTITNTGYYGGGVTNEGTFNMYSGKISGNTSSYGGGVYNNDKFNMYNGEISGNTSSYGGGVYNNDKFNMYSGEISGNTSSHGAGVYNNDKFNMYSGKISGNTSNLYSGGVYNKGTFDMYGGEISGNNSMGFGGVYNDDTFNMYGGEISGNQSPFGDGGGVNNNYNSTFSMYSGKISGNTSNFRGGGVFNRGTFNMYHGEISGNTSSDNGGGVSNYFNSTFKMLGGEISGNTTSSRYDGGVYMYSGSDVIIGGDVVIKDNYCNDSVNDLYLHANETVIIDPDNPLTGDAYIGITTEVKPTTDNPVNVSKENNGDYSLFFHSNDPAYTIENSKNNEVQLVLSHDHSLVHIEAVAPTCTEDGNEECWVCNICWKTFSDENGENRIPDIPVLEKIGHKWGKWIITTEPTETSGGEAEKICENDETHIDTVKLKELTDTTMWTKIADISPSCVNEGKRVYVSEYGMVTMTFKKLSHDYEDDWQKDNEKHWQICKNCRTVNPVSEHPHTWDEGTITVSPTTDHDGEKTFTCVICGHTKTEKIDKLPVSEPEESSSESVPEESSSESEPEESSSESEPEESSSESEPEESSSESEPEESSSESEPEESSSESEPEESSSESEPEESSSESEPEESSSESEPEESSSESVPEESSSESEPEESSSESEPEESSSESVPEESSSESVPEESSSESEPEESSSESEPEESSSESEPEESSEEPIVTPDTSSSEPAVNTTSYPSGYFVIPDISTSGTTTAEQSKSGTETIATKPDATTIPSQTTDNSQPAETDEKNGAIFKRVESKDYNVEISDSISELAKKVLTSQETELTGQGHVIEILLTVADIDVLSNTDSAAVRETLAKLNGYKAEQYLDINLYKIVDGTRYKMSNTNGTVTVTLVIPEALRAEGREYAMIRVHGGTGNVLKDLDSSADTLTFATDRFSVYALIYKDKTANEERPLNTGTGSYISVLMAAGITSMAAAMTFTLIGMEIGGMSEERKNRIYNKLIRWGKRGGKIRTYMALGLILMLLSFYYSVGMKVSDECK